MERQTLIALLDGDDMCVAVCEALSTGAAFQVWEDSGVLVTVTLSILRRRQASAERRGQPILNYTAAVEALKRYTGDKVMIGRVGDRQHSEMLFQLYLDPETQAVICCLGVPVTR